MFGWFKNKKSEADEKEAIRRLMAPIIEAQSTAVAIAQTAAEHMKQVSAGAISAPAVNWKGQGKNVQRVWSATRLETVSHAFNFGQSSLMLLADLKHQHVLIDAWLDRRPQFEFPQPRGEPTADTLQGVWQCYVYLSKLGDVTMDRETYSGDLKRRGTSIEAGFTERLIALRDPWWLYANETTRTDPARMPRFLIHEFWEDITLKSKSLAMSSVFGPSIEAGIANLEELIGNDPAGLAALRQSVARLKAATDPDAMGR